jgi:HD-GYP domain-containing protein (c-di-GMP phosphodiesterase class II)
MVHSDSVPKKTGEDDPLAGGYRRALGAIREIFRQVDCGLVPEVWNLRAAAHSLALVALRDPAELLGLTINKDCDSYSFHHSVNVGILAMALSAAMGQPLAEVEETGMAGFLHDVGKTKIDREIVSKPGKLTEQEYGEMKRHAEYGAILIRLMEGGQSRVANGVLGHHIRFDRGGYPEWARERAFSTMTGIVAVADCYDATTTQRVYQPRMLPAQAVEEIRSQGGTSLDSDIVACFLELAGRFPVGSLVRLDSNEIAVVFTPSSDPRGAAMVQLVRDSSGTALSEPVFLSLAQSGSCIVDLVEPLQEGEIACCV